MDLVDDHVRDPSEGLSRPAGEHQVEGFGGGDQDVRGLPHHPGPLLAGRIAAADGDAQGGQGSPHCLRSGQDSFEGELQVAPDVLVQCLERRDIENSDAFDFSRGPPEVVEGGQERGERLAGSGRGHDQGIPPGGDHRPTEPLSGRRLAELFPEPRCHRTMERIEHVPLVVDRLVHGCKALLGRGSSSVAVIMPPRFSRGHRLLARCFIYRSLLGREIHRRKG